MMLRSDWLTKPGRLGFTSSLLGSLIGVALSAWLYSSVFERDAFGEALFLREVIPFAFERTLIAVTLAVKSVTLCLPFVFAFSWLQSRERPVPALIVLATGLVSVFFYLMADLVIHNLHGRHLLEVLAFVRVPEGRVAGGDAYVWIVRSATCLCYALGLSAVGTVAAIVLSEVLERNSTELIRRVTVVPLFVGALVAPTLALNAGAGWRTPGLRARVAHALPWTFGGTSSLDPSHDRSSPRGSLEASLNRVYQDRFAYLFRKRERREHRPQDLKVRPNVFMVLVESWRADSFTTELMPEVTKWAEEGLVRTGHNAGTNFSESGTFTVLYGLNPLVYHAVLDSRMPPPLCEGLRALSYKCAYFTGHPTTWWRREEFLGPLTFDVHERFANGPWDEWDRRSLARLSELAKRSGEHGNLGLTFLMSTHYEYRYPKTFEKHLPVSEPAVTWSFEGVTEGFEGLKNRYKNSVGYLDFEIAKFLKAVDLERDYVIVTGDHAEAIGENKRVGHGFNFSDTLLRVPFVLRGPGVKPQRLSGLSLHEDIWPTVRSLVLGESPGRHDLRLPSRRRGALMAHCEFDQRSAKALLVHDDVRLNLRLNLDAPELDMSYFEDRHGVPQQDPPLPPQVRQRLIQAFEGYLNDAARPILSLD